MRKRIAWTDERCWDDWTGVAGVQGLLCWAIGSRPSGAGRHEGMVGTRHHRARDHMGRGGVGAFASHSRREEAAAVFDRAWRNRCIQRADDDEEEGSFARRSLSTQEIVHRRLVGLIERAPQDQLVSETRFRRRIRLDTYGHYPKHTDAILKWRRQRDVGEARDKTSNLSKR
jgi:hypothetical protein